MTEATSAPTAGATGDGAGAAAESCPVCGTPVPRAGGEPAPAVETCPRCGVVVRSGYRLGPVTPELAQEVEQRWVAVARSLDAVAALRAAGCPGPVDQGLLLRLARLVAGPPLDDEELGRARAEVVPPTGATAVATVAAAADLGTATGSPPEVHVVVVDEEGLTGRVFAAREGDGDGLVEQASAAAWSWRELLDDLPDDEVERRFRLAGGVGSGAVPFDAVRAAAERWAGGVAGTGRATVVARSRPGWAVPDAFAAAVARRLTAPDVVLPPGEGAAGRAVAVPRGPVAWAAAPAGDRALVAAGDAQGVVTAWLAPGAEPRRLTTLDVAVTSVAVGGSGVVAGSVLGRVHWAPVAGPPEPVPLPAHQGRVSAVAAAADVVAGLGTDGTLHVVPLRDGVPEPARVRVIGVGASGAAVLAVSERGQVAITAGHDGILRVVRLDRGDVAEIVLGRHVAAAAVDPTGRVAAVALGDGAVVLVPLEDASAPGGAGAATTLFHVAHTPAGPLSVQLAPAGAHVVAAAADGTITAWSAGRVTTVGRHAGGVGALRHVAGHEVLAVGRDDGVLRRWPLPAEDLHQRGTRP
jgi:hypothetical protein